MKKTFPSLLFSLLCVAAPGQLSGQPGTNSADAPGLSEGESPIAPSQKEVDSLMQLDFDAFDQDMQGGWRGYANQGQFKTAASLIVTYLEQHPGIEENHKRVMSWHAGQMYAMGGEDERAIPFMEASRKEKDVMMWNDYLDATIAFLKKDREAFERHFEVFEAATGHPNFRLLQLLETRFEKSYQKALQAAMN